MILGGVYLPVKSAGDSPSAVIFSVGGDTNHLSIIPAPLGDRPWVVNSLSLFIARLSIRDMTPTIPCLSEAVRH